MKADLLREDVRRIIRETLRPAPEELPSQWCERNLFLPSRTSSRPGQLSFYPFQRAFVDAFAEPDVHTIVNAKASRTGYTQCKAAILSWLMAQRGSPVVAVYPTEGSARKFRDTYLKPMWLESPEMMKIVPGFLDEQWHNPSTSLGGDLTLKWSTKPDAFAEYSARDIAGDEIDRSAWGDGGDGVSEGSKLDLMEKRLDSFDDGRRLLGSSPGTTEGSRIWPIYERGDQRKLHFCCPQCGEEQVPIWGNPDTHGVKWPKDDPKKAFYVCLSGCAIEPDDYYRAINAGAFLPTAFGEPGIISFHWPGLISPFEKSSLGALASKFVPAARAAKKRNYSALQAFVNTSLGETWDTPELGKSAKPHELEARCEDYGAEVPEWARVLAAGFDTQSGKEGEVSYSEGSIYAYGAGGRKALVGHFDVREFGLHDRRHWAQVRAILDRPYRTPKGRQLLVTAAAFDTGSNRNELGPHVVRFCNEAHAAGRCFYSIKGGANLRGERGTSIWPGKTSGSRSGGYMYVIDTWVAKDEIFRRLSIEPSLEDMDSIHFPSVQRVGNIPVDRNFFVRLTRERPKPVKGFPGIVGWQSQPKDQEPWDSQVYADAALEGAMIERPAIRGIVAAPMEIRASIPRIAEASAVTPKPVAPKTKQSSVKKSKWIS